ncbi:hypothetical protein A3A71_02115 [Candidatus Berkelbacteria bacterium RIFCSPLOWO2_01_FULL_50_28]|uniref:Uncharacterized protein n=1 Tax=Candidatus Berkelbacteria bacterium RIFCSPLOWO2_01_FULL_50_28 TaxID=1797471 RepID=A0A1F5EBM6_9BACT|nr:MAG: hypothetical protein A2807_00510 [Candidatus Berkelbacteria bacterium RIFCSPHIGHO2_01_FULL_50_36]OGD63233.1 MAG: hypothetical protein A3F39_02380 [Candidatus Berkelbacteria bacterium RIFCSPHIGHO2_12_FULL_50_11]OGD64819.1 MAG: hypothetical protein A3A71_02115 [Candidatus Berkelbacteria bacterium RIFCSPLOWO2_01_FULL_50_28]
MVEGGKFDRGEHESVGEQPLPTEVSHSVEHPAQPQEPQMSHSVPTGLESLQTQQPDALGGEPASPVEFDSVVGAGKLETDELQGAVEGFIFANKPEDNV